MSNYKATPEQWKKVEESAAPSAVVTGGSTDSCILELRARVAKLEAQVGSREVADPAPVAGGLVTRVIYAICGTNHAGIDWSPEARAAILEVATWLREQGTPASGWAMRLEQEAGR
jgi:hypothetical protein